MATHSDASNEFTDLTFRIGKSGNIQGIHRIDTDRAGRFLVAASTEKEVPLWSLPEGELIHTFRFPIRNLEGDPKSGDFKDAAISPDGEIIAAGGYGYKNADHPVYIVERKSHRVLSTIFFDHQVRSLAFSPSGSFLAVGLYKGGGLRIIDTNTWEVIFEDRDYAGWVYDVVFDSKDNVYSTDRKSVLVRHRPESESGTFVRTGSITTEFGSPQSLAVSPSDELLAVAFGDATEVLVYSASDLKYLYKTDTSPWKAAGYWSRGVTWSNDGEYLYAGTTSDTGYTSEDLDLLLRWSEQGRGQPQAVPTCGWGIVSLSPLGSKGVINGADDCVSAHNDDGGRLWQKDIWTPYMDELPFRLETSETARQIKLSSREGRVAALLFDHEEMVSMHRDDGTVSWNFIDSVLETKEYVPDHIDHEHGTGKFVYQNTEYDLGTTESIYGFDIDENSNEFVVGTNFNLHAFDASTGEKLSSAPIQGDGVRLLNIAPDGKLIVALMWDGSVRWYRRHDLQELLALVAMEGDDNNRPVWIAFTPAGYYDASAGGEDLIGWQVDRGPGQESLYYGASRFRALFYRPDIVADALVSQEVAAGPSEEDIRAHMPPVVRITEIEPEGDDRVRIKYEVASPSGKSVKNVRVLGDDRLQANVDPATSDTEFQQREITVPAPSDISTISMTASSEDGYGEMETKGFTPVKRDSPEARRKPKLHAFIVGVSDYLHSPEITDLNYADDDARQIAQLLEAQRDGTVYGEMSLVDEVLTDGMATRNRILEGLDKLAAAPTDHDVSILYLSGHGHTLYEDTEDPPFYFLSHDASMRDLPGTAVGGREIVERYMLQAKGTKIVFIDACRSAGVDQPGLYNLYARGENAAYVFVSSSEREKSFEYHELENGAFTEAVLDAFLGAADSPPTDDVVNDLELGDHIEKFVVDFTNAEQRPLAAYPGGFRRSRSMGDVVQIEPGS